jgi:hypothetical protein
MLEKLIDYAKHKNEKINIKDINHIFWNKGKYLLND